MSLPKLGIGVAFRMQHFEEIQKSPGLIEWFELFTEHFLEPSQWSTIALDFLSEQYPLVLHGVSLGIGNSTPLDFDYLRKVKALAKRVRAPWISDHLCWGQIPGAHFHDLLPLPFRKDVADYVVERARIVQDYLEIPFALENLSSCVQAEDREMDEWEFYSYVVRQANVYMMLDVNNVYVSSRNIGFDVDQYLASLPYDRIVQVHLAGHSETGEWVMDTHDRPVRDEVWNIYKKVWRLADQPATLLE